MAWLWWVGAALIFALIELLSLDFVFIMFAGGALAAGVANAAGTPLWVQAIVFVVASVVLLDAAAHADPPPAQQHAEGAHQRRGERGADGVGGPGGQHRVGADQAQRRGVERTGRTRLASAARRH